MTAYIALLRGINVGGKKKIAMADLRALAEELGFENPRTLLQSGNLVFGLAGADPAALEAQLEQAIEQRLGLDVTVMVRTADEWDAVIAANPFPDEAVHMPNRLLVTALRDAPSAQAVDALRAGITGPERVHVDGRHLYIFYGEGMADSKLSNNVMESRLKTRGTARNWNTALKLAALARG